MLISICIPTYNQPENLRRALLGIEKQITKEVEVVVRDDSTNDETQKIAEAFSKRFPINYIRGKKEGLDVAIISLTEEASGMYVWWIGDDAIEEGAVARVVALIQQYPELDFICLNNREKSAKEPVLHLGGDKFFKDNNEVLEQVVDLLGFISITIFKRARALSGIVGAEKWIGSAFVNLYLVLHVLSQGGKAYFISHPYVVSDPRAPEKPAWYDGFTVFAVNLYYIVQEFKDKFDRRAIKNMLADNLDGILKGILVYRAKGYEHGLGSRSPKLPILAKLYWSYPGFWYAFPLLLIPRNIIKIMYGWYKKFSRVSS